MDNRDNKESVCSLVGFSQGLSASQQCFSLTTNQHQPGLSFQKPTSEQAEYVLDLGGREVCCVTRVRERRRDLFIVPTIDRGDKPRHHHVSCHIMSNEHVLLIYSHMSYVSNGFFVEP